MMRRLLKFEVQGGSSSGRTIVIGGMSGHRGQKEGVREEEREIFPLGGLEAEAAIEEVQALHRNIDVSRDLVSTLRKVRF
jgi:hypothetical protein